MIKPENLQNLNQRFMRRQRGVQNLKFSQKKLKNYGSDYRGDFTKFFYYMEIFG